MVESGFAVKRLGDVAIVGEALERLEVEGSRDLYVEGDGALDERRLSRRGVLEVKVKLDWFEVYQAAEAGAFRRIEALKRSRPEPYGLLARGFWDTDIEACAAEMAVAKAFNVYWTPVTRRPARLPGDAGCLQVRSTPLAHGRLILHERDRDEAIFVLVTGQIPDFDIRGFILASDGKQKRNWKNGDGRPAYFVHQRDLRPPADLFQILRTLADAKTD